MVVHRFKPDEGGATHAVEGGGGGGAWYRLFKHVDADGSGQIDFAELRRMVRVELSLPSTSVKEAELKALWGMSAGT